MKYSLLDLFCGAGGLSLGFDYTNRFNVVAGLDSDAHALQTFYSNHSITPKTYQQPVDISSLSSKELLSKLETNRIDVIVGGPPCQGFSVAGKRDVNDNRNQLVWDFFRFVSEIHPTIFVMENVPGFLLAKHDTKYSLVEALRQQMEQLGYKCELWHLNAAHYGVPQIRKRVMLVGMLNDTALKQPAITNGDNNTLFSSLNSLVTVQEALSDLPIPTLDERQSYLNAPSSNYQMYLRSKSTAIYNHTPSIHKPEMIERLRLQQNGSRLYSNCNHSWYKLLPNKPSPTVKENHRAPFVHHQQPRVTTPRECARLQSFPDHYIFYGTKTAQLKQIGNAVPPLLAFAVAKQVVEALDNTIADTRQHLLETISSPLSQQYLDIVAYG